MEPPVDRRLGFEAAPYKTVNYNVATTRQWDGFPELLNLKGLLLMTTYTLHQSRNMQELI